MAVMLVYIFSEPPTSIDWTILSLSTVDSGDSADQFMIFFHDFITINTYNSNG